MVTTTITLEDGSTGTGYSYTGGKGGYAIKAMIDHDLAPVLSGKEALRLTISMTLWNSIFTIWVAMSAVNIALWDLKGKREKLPLWKMAG
ncbi:hypothetical protein NEF24_002192 [Salmonella enterica subsp. enterica serovar London]|nr:hypothetical protein [Salmonella enterica subsp. enterica serovar London]ELL3699968.1 hypothetical protein [Salmonella enterica subsp. enterica serovar London]